MLYEQVLFSYRLYSFCKRMKISPVIINGNKVMNYEYIKSKLINY
jgi:hypothetical protein